MHLVYEVTLPAISVWGDGWTAWPGSFAGENSEEDRRGASQSANLPVAWKTLDQLLARSLVPSFPDLAFSFRTLELRSQL